MATLAQQKSRKLLAGATQRMYVETGANQIAHRRVPGVRNPHRRQLPRPVQLGEADGVPPVRLDPIARPLGDQRRRDDNAFVFARRQLALNAITARPRLLSFRHPVKWANSALQCNLLDNR